MCTVVFWTVYHNTCALLELNYYRNCYKNETTRVEREGVSLEKPLNDEGSVHFHSSFLTGKLRVVEKIIDYLINAITTILKAYK